MNAAHEKFVPEPERYELSSSALHHFSLQRRDFFKVMGAGIAIFTVAGNAVSAQESGARRGHRDEDRPKDISSWLHINDDGIVTVFTGKVEVGQNTRTTLAQSVADELRVPLASVRMVMGDTAVTPFDMGTFGSRSTPYMSPQLRRAAAAARELLLAQAAAEWNISPDKLTVRDGKISNLASGATLTYAQLAQGKTLARNMPDADPITQPEQGIVAGKSAPKMDARAFVTGEHKYPPDARLLIFPSLTVSLSGEMFHSAAACARSSSRAAAAARRSCGDMYGVERLPKVPISNGVTAVSPMTIRTLASGTRSSSATDCARVVRVFWPTSTLPVKTVTMPSSLMCSQDEISFGRSSSGCPRRAPDSGAKTAFPATVKIAMPAPITLKKSRRCRLKWCNALELSS